MKIKNMLVVAATSVATLFACADQGDILITFSTPGTDKYADGTTVRDGEWYAVCWAKDGTFDGLTTDCKAIGANEEVILAAPLAKNGRLPLTAFEFPRLDKYNSGKFSIFMLDTRDANGNVAARGANGLPVFVQGEAVAMTTKKKGSTAMEVTAETTVASGSAQWGSATLQAGNVADATIKAIEIVGDNVVLTVEGLKAGTVVVKTGDKVDQLNTFAVPQASANDSTTFIVPKNKGKFFSVVTVQ